LLILEFAYDRIFLIVLDDLDVDEVSEFLFDFSNSGQLIIKTFDFFEEFVFLSPQVDFSLFLIEFLFINFNFFHDSLLFSD
jgi:hypothetical protein